VRSGPHGPVNSATPSKNVAEHSPVAWVVEQHEAPGIPGTLWQIGVSASPRGGVPRHALHASADDDPSHGPGGAPLAPTRPPHPTASIVTTSTASIRKGKSPVFSDTAR
jgi:hypothetical protein